MIFMLLAHYVNIRTSGRPRDDPPQTRCRAAGPPGSHPPPRRLPCQTQPENPRRLPGRPRGLPPLYEANSVYAPTIGKAVEWLLGDLGGLANALVSDSGGR